MLPQGSWQQASTHACMREPTSLETSTTKSERLQLLPMLCECVCIWLHQVKIGVNSSDQRSNHACRKRFVFVNLDACMASQGVTITVLEQLKVLALVTHCHMPFKGKCMSSA